MVTVPPQTAPSKYEYRADPKDDPRRQKASVTLHVSRDKTVANGPEVTEIEPYARIHGAAAVVHIISHSRTTGSRDADS